MSSKEEVAALMATGDADTKISLLKKAVVSVTKQKQLLEQHNLQLQSQMAAIGSELSTAQEECTSLQRRLKAAEAELEAERGRRHFMKSTWKGLSSLVTGADSDARGKPSVLLSLEDQEKLIAENESLHMQLFDARTRADDACRARQSEDAQLEREVLDLRALLDAATHACDGFHAQSARDAVLAQFCKCFFAPAWSPRHKRLSLRPAAHLGTPPVDSAGHSTGHSAGDSVLSSAAAALRALLGGAAALFAALRDAAPAGPARCARDRLSALLAAHAQRREAADDALRALEGAMRRGDGAEAIAALQDDVLAATDEWLALVALHARLLAQVSVQACAGAKPNANISEWSGEAIAAECVAAVSAARGAVDALRHVCRGAGTALRATDTVAAAEWLVALERFWWSGCAGSAALRGAAAALASRVGGLSETAAGDALRAALLFVRRALCELAEPRPTAAGPGAETLGLEDPKGAEEEKEGGGEGEWGGGGGGGGGEAEEPQRDEVLEALAAADRAAVCYHAQLCQALAELAETQSALGAAREDARRARAVAEERADDTEKVREALEEQIRILSERLIECDGCGA